MKNIVLVACVMFAGLCVATPASAQCKDGTCRIRPIKNIKPVQRVIQNKPVRTKVYTIQRCQPVRKSCRRVFRWLW